MCLCHCVHAWRGQKLTSSVTPQERPTLFSEVSHYAWGFSEADWQGSTGDLPVPAFQYWRITNIHSQDQIFTLRLGLNSGPCAYTSTWVTELSSRTPLMVLFKICAENTCSTKVLGFHATMILAGISNFRSLKLICTGASYLLNRIIFSCRGGFP